VGKDRRNYFRQRAAEELAAAERATSVAAASAHRELSLRYALALILPERDDAGDDARPIGQPRATAPARRFLPLPSAAGERRRG
jgi:hypothetical protein